MNQSPFLPRSPELMAPEDTALLVIEGEGSSHGGIDQTVAGDLLARRQQVIRVQSRCFHPEVHAKGLAARARDLAAKPSAEQVHGQVVNDQAILVKKQVS